VQAMQCSCRYGIAIDVKDIHVCRDKYRHERSVPGVDSKLSNLTSRDYKKYASFSRSV